MKILCLIDLQNDFINGSLGSAEAQAIVPKVVEKLKNIDIENTLVLFTKDTHYDDYLDTFEGKMLPVKHCIENTNGWSINKEIASVVDNTEGMLYYSSSNIKHSRIYKNTFGSDDLRDFFIKHKDEIDEVEFCGLCTDICVISNVLMARQAMPDKVITVDASCCAGVTPEKHLAALEVMKSCQIDVIGE
jgi:nicotinamidase-related amidase